MIEGQFPIPVPSNRRGVRERNREAGTTRERPQRLPSRPEEQRKPQRSVARPSLDRVGTRPGRGLDQRWSYRRLRERGRRRGRLRTVCTRTRPERLDGGRLSWSQPRAWYDFTSSRMLAPAVWRTKAAKCSGASPFSRPCPWAPCLFRRVGTPASRSILRPESSASR